MPRMQPPRGYIRSKEAQDILNVSPAMIRYYVIEGKIKHLVPNGRTQGFYLESDVRNLASELNLLFNQEKTEIISFAPATETDILSCISLNRELFTASTSASDEVLSKKWTEWIQKNTEVVYVLKRNKEVVGIITMIPFKAVSKKFEEIIVGNTSILLGDVNISQKDVEEYKAGKSVQIYLAEIGIKPTLEKTLRRKYGAKLIKNLLDIIVNLGKRGVIIENIKAVGATRSGIRLLQHFGFNEVTFSRPDTRMFILNMKESGAPVSIQYRQALKEYQENHEL